MSLVSKASELLVNKHKKYFLNFLNMVPGSLATYDSSRLTIAFFAISGLDVLDSLTVLGDSRKKDICNWIYGLQLLPNKCEEEKCGFQGSSTLIIMEDGRSLGVPHYSCSNLAMTYTGLACLIILGDDLSRVNRKACIRGVRALQQNDGSFRATLPGSENDMRFVYCAACVCYMLADWSGMDKDKAVSYISSSLSYDYGVGQGPDLESHGGSTYCAIAALTLMGKLHDVFSRKQLEGLKRWVVMRQVGGFQGRPNKPEDTCYTFWVGATLKLLDMLEMIAFKENREYVMSTQYPITGGFSKWPESGTDAMHTYLGLSGLSLIGEEGLLEVNPALNITKKAVSHLNKLQEKWVDVRPHNS